MERIVAYEPSLSDMLQLLSDRDRSPWQQFVGFEPTEVTREEPTANNADLLLTADDGGRAVIEVKLGHILGQSQQSKYEALPGAPTLYLAALSSDRDRLSNLGSERWKFLSLRELFGSWQYVADETARVIAGEVTSVLQGWDDLVVGVFTPRTDPDALPLSSLTHKFLARVVTRRMEVDLATRHPYARALVSSGSGGLAFVQAWTRIRSQHEGRYFIAEVRWRENRLTGELRFGVDFDPEAGKSVDESLRRAAYDLACTMEDQLDFEPLHRHLHSARPELATMVSTRGRSRPPRRGDWEAVMRHGFSGAPLANGKENSRRATRPGFYGDRTLRFEALVDVDFRLASAVDVIALIDSTLEYLSDSEPSETA
ncbi:hypothetical protein ABXI96_01975 [Gordonia polyisoprenivorans]|nr:hypothetical protein [Gordonia polyisoprenivorans]